MIRRPAPLSIRAVPAVLAALAALSSASCGKGRTAAVATEGEGDVKAFVSVERVEVRSGPSSDSGRTGSLSRGAEIRLRGYTAGFGRVVLPTGSEGWLPAGSFERLADRQARLTRTEEVARFKPQPGRVLEQTPLFLGPHFGAAQYGGLEEGTTLEVLLADHDFYGVLLPGKILAFVPARSLRLIPDAPEVPAPPASDAAAPHPGGPGGPAGPGGRETPPKAPSPPGTPPPPEPVRSTPYEALPIDAEAPVLVTRVDPRYPEFARKAGMSGDVQLKVLVDAEGKVSRVEVVAGAPGGMTEAATDAVRRWVYQPAKVAGRPVAVWKVVRVHFAIDGKGTRGEEVPPL